MGEEIELAADAFGAAVGELAERSGILGPVQEVIAYLTSYIRPRREAFAAQQFVKVAEKVKRSGLPPAAIEDGLLRALVEGNAEADDESMRERWANLLANALVAGPVIVKAAYPKVLGELDPAEASMLDGLATGRIVARGNASGVKFVEIGGPGLEPDGWVNLEQRQGLVQLREINENVDLPEDVPDRVRLPLVELTAFGLGFVLACQEPQPTMEPGSDP